MYNTSTLDVKQSTQSAASINHYEIYSLIYWMSKLTINGLLCEDSLQLLVRQHIKYL